MKSKTNILIVFGVIFVMLAGCGGNVQIKEDKAGLTIGKIIARRLGVAAAQRYPVIVAQVEPIARAILESSANGDDLIKVLQNGLIKTPYLDPLTKRDIADLLDLVTINNEDTVCREVARAFLEGITNPTPLNLPNVESGNTQL